MSSIIDYDDQLIYITAKRKTYNYVYISRSDQIGWIRLGWVRNQHVPNLNLSQVEESQP